MCFCQILTLLHGCHGDKTNMNMLIYNTCVEHVQYMYSSFFRLDQGAWYLIYKGKISQI